jgi:hypothetical protein
MTVLPVVGSSVQVQDSMGSSGLRLLTPASVPDVPGPFMPAPTLAPNVPGSSTTALEPASPAPPSARTGLPNANPAASPGRVPGDTSFDDYNPAPASSVHVPASDPVASLACLGAPMVTSAEGTSSSVSAPGSSTPANPPVHATSGHVVPVPAAPTHARTHLQARILSPKYTPTAPSATHARL